jgi:DNA-binding transcriptional regulator YiaG
MADAERDYAALVKVLRRRLGLTQEQFAHRLGVTFASVNRWENGQVKPSPMARQKLEVFDQQTVPERLSRRREPS